MTLDPQWVRRPGDRTVRRPRRQEYRPLRLRIPKTRVPSRRAAPLVFIYGFAMLILAGTALLSMPISNVNGEVTPFFDALFTSTSAVTVTGLVVADTGAYWSTAGQGVILGLIFLGGLGFMTGATFLLMLIGRRISLANRLLVRDSLGQVHLGGVVKLVKRIVGTVILIQIVGWAFLWWRLAESHSGLQRVWQSLFHAISGFNNAGFSILPNSESLSGIHSDVPILLILIVLMVLGGIGYSVMVDILEIRQPLTGQPLTGISKLFHVRLRRFSRMTLDTKMVLLMSLVLWLLGLIIILAAEYNNPATLGDMSTLEKVVNGFFQSVSVRTAGFSTIDYSLVEQHTVLFSTGLMFIGGASASTAGGIKITTLAVLLWTVWSSLRGRDSVVAFGREIPVGQVHRALVVVVGAVFSVFVVAFALTLTEGIPFLAILMEVVSAFGTNGLSTGVTSELSTVGRFIITVAMFLGRIGPLTVALALAQREEIALYRYTQERVKIG
jgi:trk system potassium uptake protein TrkH